MALFVQVLHGIEPVIALVVLAYLPSSHADVFALHALAPLLRRTDIFALVALASAYW